MEEFLAVLDQCSHSLEKLKLAFYGPGLPSGTLTYPSFGMTVNLPQLRIFDIDHHAIDIAYLLAHISFPHTAQLTLRFKATENVPLEICFPTDSTVFKHLRDITWFNLTADNSSAQLTCDNLDLSVFLVAEVVTWDDNNPRRVSAFLPKFASYISTPHTVKEVDIHCMWPIVILEDDWFRAFSHLPCLNALTFCQSQDEDMWSPFGMCEPLVTEKEDGDLVCPELKNLVLDGICFTMQSGKS